MLDMLKKFEEESVADQTLLEDEAEDSSDLVRRFGAVDLGMYILILSLLHTYLAPIDSTTPDALWAMLTSAERSKFITVFNNPTGELAQQLEGIWNMETPPSKARRSARRQKPSVSCDFHRQLHDSGARISTANPTATHLSP